MSSSRLIGFSVKDELIEFEQENIFNVKEEHIWDYGISSESASCFVAGHIQNEHEQETFLNLKQEDICDNRMSSEPASCFVAEHTQDEHEQDGIAIDSLSADIKVEEKEFCNENNECNYVKPEFCNVKIDIYEDKPCQYSETDYPESNTYCENEVKPIIVNFVDDSDQMSDNLLDKSGDVRQLLMGDVSDKSASDSSSDFTADIQDFSSDSSDNYLPGEEDYESIDSRCPPAAPNLLEDLARPSTSGYQPQPVAASTPTYHAGHDQMLSEDDPVLPGPSAPAPTTVQRTTNVPQTPAPTAPWIRVYDGEPRADPSTEFTVRNPGPRDCPPTHTPIDYFHLFFTGGLLLLLVRETNIYAQKMIDEKRRQNKLTPRSRLSSWVNVTVSEMKRYLGILFVMTVCHRKSIVEYWTNDSVLHIPAIKAIMSLRRFEVLSSVLHLTSRPSLYRGTPGYDPWVKIRPFLDVVNEAFVRHYTPTQNLSLDESMVGMKNRNVFIQYMPNKRYARYGIKKFELVDATTSYVVQLSMYSCKDFLENTPGPFTQKVVMDLLEKGKCLDKGYHVFTNNFYTKLPLAHELLERKTFLTGTISKVSKFLPRSLVTANFVVGEPVYYRQGQVLVLGFKLKPTRIPVFLLSTGHEANSENVRNSRGIVSKKPVVINRYNKFMGGVDCKDKSFYRISCTQTAKKYWKKLFYNLIDTCVQNAYVMYNQQCAGLHSAMSRYTFLVSLIHSLTEAVEPAQPNPLQRRLTYNDAAGAAHSFATIPNKSKKLCPVCFKRATSWCPGCNCGVHRDCFPRLEHRYRPTNSVRKPKRQPDDSD